MGLKDMDCHASLAMTGSGLPRFACNDDGDGYDVKNFVIARHEAIHGLPCRLVGQCFQAFGEAVGEHIQREFS
jgi:hypothetical protein